MRLAEILASKSPGIRTIDPGSTCDDVVTELVRHNVGSLLVCDAGGRVIGIITERDILRVHADKRSAFSTLRVADVMSRELVTADPEDHILTAMRLMTQHRIRHLPVMRSDVLLGIISIGDVVKAHHDELEVENHYMRSYIQGEGSDRDAG